MDGQKLVCFTRRDDDAAPVREVLVPDAEVQDVIAQCEREGFSVIMATPTKRIRVEGRAYLAWMIPGTEAHPCYATGDIDAAARAICQRRHEFTRELRNDPNLARWKVERELDAYEDEATTWRRTG